MPSTPVASRWKIPKRKALIEWVHTPPQRCLLPKQTFVSHQTVTLAKRKSGNVGTDENDVQNDQGGWFRKEITVDIAEQAEGEER